MKAPKMPEDVEAANIEFGIELETIVPANAGIAPGPYHGGFPVETGRTAAYQVIPAPCFNGRHWKAERDASILATSGYVAIEFVSPVLKGKEGLAHLIEFINWLNQIGSRVNFTCGCHITVGIRSLMPGQNVGNTEIARFVRRLARFANNHAWAIYGQTGTSRHLNQYSHRLPASSKVAFDEMLEAKEGHELASLCQRAGRGMVNFKKSFRPGAEVVEFRAFAGTLNVNKVLHHLATSFAICRKVVASKEVPPFFRSEQIVRLQSAQDAVKRLWKVMGWSRKSSTHSVALGLFGPLHSEWGAYQKDAMRMAGRFDERFPNANL